MQDKVITKEVFLFLKELGQNNTREWFAQNKGRFKELESSIKDIFGLIMEKMKQHDDIEKMKVFRIYRDVRFSKDKTPYKKHFAGSYTRAGARLRGGYYIHIQPDDDSFIGAGFWKPNKEDLFRIRKELELDAEDFKNVIYDEKLNKIWGNLVGEELKKAPRGFDKEHSDIALMKKKQFVFIRKFTDNEVLSEDFAKNVDESFKAVRPYFDLMSDILTTNLNGESLLG
ncbi:MAG: TIGR02453 family protein [Maribacter sp.]|nr:MAG: TIGR02453 family protein [Maribacter sp.]